MTTGTPLATAIWKADRHLDTLNVALRDWRTAPAADLAELETDREKPRFLGQLLVRFTKLHDALGLRLVRATVDALSRPFEDWSMIDRLNRLEKLGYLDVGDWLRSRETRNRLAQDHPDHPEARFVAIEPRLQPRVISRMRGARGARNCTREQGMPGPAIENRAPTGRNSCGTVPLGFRCGQGNPGFAGASRRGRAGVGTLVHWAFSRPDHKRKLGNAQSGVPSPRDPWVPIDLRRAQGRGKRKGRKAPDQTPLRRANYVGEAWTRPRRGTWTAD